ncbi:RNA methyltransferase, TrmA family [hydrothermal vent metagenome]|uniref:RNA methyltransferase, TrmA family n=1 Tax=hydrothermal vent metagenome TaxID=652676 RepID=A0A1W1D2J1_9ZZZZ
MDNSQAYKEKKAFFEKMITLYGRNVVLEVLQDTTINIYKLHMANSNKTDKTIKKMLLLAKERGIEVLFHDKKRLSQISKNAKQDQGVAIDILSKSYQDALEIQKLHSFKLIALDEIHNPQNLGMIIRSCAAGNVDGIILPQKNSAKISPLVVKASAGTLFKIPIYYCQTLLDILPHLKDTTIYALSSYAQKDIYTIKPSQKSIFVLGNESKGVSKDVLQYCNDSLKIPMNRGVESLNVAVTASLIAFLRV